MLSPHPLRRDQQLTVQILGEETLVYDERTHRACCLNRISAAVWSRCDGHHTPRDIADGVTRDMEAPVSEEIVLFALGELGRDGLLQPATAATVIDERTTTRRELIRKLGLSAALLVPVITVLEVPKAAASGGGDGCVLPDTLIQLADGSELQARHLVAGQWLRGFDPVSGKLRPGRLKSVHPFCAPRIHTLFSESGEALQASPSHLLLAGPGDRDGKPLESFRTGDEIMVFSHREERVIPSRLTAITTIDVPQDVIAFEVETTEHTFVTGGMVSHNKICCPGDPGDDAAAQKPVAGALT